MIPAVLGIGDSFRFSGVQGTRPSAVGTLVAQRGAEVAVAALGVAVAVAVQSTPVRAARSSSAEHSCREK